MILRNRVPFLKYGSFFAQFRWIYELGFIFLMVTPPRHAPGRHPLSWPSCLGLVKLFNDVTQQGEHHL